MKKFILCMCLLGSAISLRVHGQNIIIQNQNTITTEGAEQSAKADIGGVEFRRVRDGETMRNYFEFENFHSFPVTVEWRVAIKSEKYSHWFSYGDEKEGTIVLRANETKRTNEKYSYGYELVSLKVRRL